MAVFNIDPEQALESIAIALEDAGVYASDVQFDKIATAIEKALPGTVQVIAQGAAEYWKSEAEGRGGGWGAKYAAAIRYEVTGTSAVIDIDESMMDKTSGKANLMYAEMIEKGVKSWSIKDALLKSEKAKISSAGIKYIVIPFPVAAPRKPSAGKGRSHFGGREMTADMHRIVKSGGRLTGGTLKSGVRDMSASGLSQYNTRQLHSQFGIFMCVTKESKGWMHPGAGPDPVFPEVLAYLNRQIGRVVAALCKAIVQEYSK